MRALPLVLFTLLFFCNCKEEANTNMSSNLATEYSKEGVSLVVLGTAQDAGSPQIACKKECCSQLFIGPSKSREVVSLGIMDYDNNKSYLFEATPDITKQIKFLSETMNASSQELPNGIFLTHAHIGHYTGLMYLGKEAVNADKVPVFAMPRLKSFLQQNGPWSQLVTNGNIDIYPLEHETEVELTNQLKVVPFVVPHRDEYSETVGYKIYGPNKSALFIPDIDKWSVWDTSVVDLLGQVDYAFLDATFFDGKELNTRDISGIPHPFVIESLKLFGSLSANEKKKIHFIHFNHTNPLLKEDSSQTMEVLEKGFRIARKGMVFKL